MTVLQINDTEPRRQYTASPSQTVFTYPFEIFEDSDIAVYIDGVKKTLTTDYTVTGAGQEFGGTVVLVTPATGGEIVTIYRDLPYSRDNLYTTSGPFKAANVERDFDKLVAMSGQLDRDIGYCIRQALEDTASSSQLLLPVATTRANQVLAFGSQGEISLQPLAYNLSSTYDAVVDYTALRAILAPNDGDTVAVTNDGIAGIFSFDAGEASTDDGGIYIDPTDGTTGAWRRRFDGTTIYAKWYGVAADGTTDDTTALQAALDYIKAVPGAILVLPPGQMILSDSLEIPDGSKIIGCGNSFDGNGGSVLKLADSTNLTSAILRSTAIVDSSISAGYPIILEDFAIDGNKANNGSGTEHGIHVANFLCSFRNIDIKNCNGNGIFFDDTNITTGTAVENKMQFLRILSCDGHGIFVNKISGVGTFTDGFIQNCIVGRSGQDGIRVDRAAGWMISNNHVYASGESGIACNFFQNSHVKDNLIEDWGDSTTAGTFYGIRCNGIQDGKQKPGACAGNTLFNEATLDAGQTFYVINIGFGAGVTAGRINIVGNAMYDANSNFLFRITGTGNGEIFATGNNGVRGAGLPGGVWSDGITVTLLVDRANSWNASFTTWSSGNTSPPVQDGEYFFTANAAPTTITTFDGGYPGKRVYGVIGDANTTLDFSGGGNLKGNGGVNWVPGSGDWFQAFYDGTNWLCEVHEI